MLDITKHNLEADLIQASMVQPVLLDIWAPWCGPCKSLGPVLEKLEAEYGGAFVLGKLNSDDEPEIAGQLSQMFGVRSIPFCVMFSQGQPVDGFVGAVPEAQLRTFLDKHVTARPPLDAEPEAPAPELSPEDAQNAELERLLAAVHSQPESDSDRALAIQALLKAGRGAQARLLFEPVQARADAKVLLDQRLVAVQHWLAALQAEPSLPPVADLEARLASNRRDFDARYALAQHHLLAQAWTQAMDELLEIILRDKTWQDDLARRTYVAILEFMTPPAPKRQPGASGQPGPSGQTGKAGMPAAAAAAPEKALQLSGHAVFEKADPVLEQYRRKLSMALF
ncbi:tetratricopeptide repeat protein [Amphibiibacter pelophylacis]|uniref:Tetratricopeptide repeat protein n=1 Tax=Amphibiibacter pelophylacis TaxID=1799477 RepID=A0ACC6P508_9BURK